MKSVLTFSAILAIALLLWQCNRTTYTADTFPESDYLTFGSGGGYAGSMTTHYLLSNGQLFTSKSLSGEKTAVGKIGARKAKKLFQEYQDSLINVQYDEPGNVYQFLEWKGADTMHKVQWAKGQAEAPAVAQTFYQQLIGLLPKED